MMLRSVMERVTDEDRRTRVLRLLGQLESKKLQRAGTAEALRLAREARHEATRPYEVVQPWPAVTAYRYAHLLLRANPQRQEELEEIDELLNEAGREKVLGPWPALYRLTVLHRLRRRWPVSDMQPVVRVTPKAG
jgi:hypothetical protein